MWSIWRQLNTVAHKYRVLKSASTQVRIWIPGSHCQCAIVSPLQCTSRASSHKLHCCWTSALPLANNGIGIYYSSHPLFLWEYGVNDKIQDVSKMYTVQCTVISHIIACALLSDIALCTLLSISPSMSLYIIHYTCCVPSMPYCLSCSHNAMWSLLTIGWGLFSTDMPGTHCQTHDEETCEKLFLGNIFSLPMFSSWFRGLHVGMGWNGRYLHKYMTILLKSSISFKSI